MKLIIFWIFIAIFATHAQDCNDLSNPASLTDGSTITLTENCIINTTQIIEIDKISITIDGQGNDIDFIMNQPHLFSISNSGTLIMRNVSIQSPTKYNDSSYDIDSIFYLFNDASLSLDSVHFVNTISGIDDYLYIKHIIFSPKSESSSSVTIQQSSFQSQFAINSSAIYMNSDDCNSQISVTDTVYNHMSQVCHLPIYFLSVCTFTTHRRF